MAWFVIAGAAVAGMYAIDRNKTVSCSYCKKQCRKKDFDYYSFAGQEEEKFARKWLRKKPPLCTECGKKMEDAYKLVLKNIDCVAVVPIESKGNKYQKRIKNRVPVAIDSQGYYDSKEEALKELKINALLHRSSIVTDVYYDHNAGFDQKGNPADVWIAKGTAYVPEETRE